MQATGRPIHLLIGGFHLLHADAAQVEQVIKRLQGLARIFHQDARTEENGLAVAAGAARRGEFRESSLCGTWVCAQGAHDGRTTPYPRCL
jgi:hypothetical protein